MVVDLARRVPVTTGFLSQSGGNARGVLTASGVCWRRDGRTVVGPTPSFAPGRQVVVEVAVNQRPPDRLFRRPEHGARSLAHPLEAINPERYKHAS